MRGQDGHGSLASFHYVQNIYNIYCSLAIYQKGHHLKKVEKTEIQKSQRAEGIEVHETNYLKSLSC